MIQAMVSKMQHHKMWTAVIALLISVIISIVWAFLSLELQIAFNNSKAVNELNSKLNEIKTKTISISRMSDDSVYIEDAFTQFVLASRTIQEIAYISNKQYIYTDRSQKINIPIKENLKQYLEQYPNGFLIRTNTSLNDVVTISYVFPAGNGFFQLFLNKNYLSQWLGTYIVMGSLKSELLNQAEVRLISTKSEQLIHEEREYSPDGIFSIQSGYDWAIYFNFVIYRFSIVVVLMLFVASVFSFAYMLAYKYHLSFESDVLRGLKNNEIIPYYQAIVSNKTKQRVGAELLCRWYYRRQKIMDPSTFINKLENNGQIKEVTLHLLRQLAKDKPHLADGNDSFYVSVNVTIDMLTDEAYLDEIKTLISSNKSLQTGLVFELTERQAVSDKINQIVKSMASLRKYGIRWALDDFGTGYAGLSTLKTLNFDIIKIDKTFVESSVTDSVTHSILFKMVELAHDLQCTMVAEGVENEIQAKKVTDLGVEYTQGYLYAKPVAKDQFCRLYDK